MLETSFLIVGAGIAGLCMGIGLEALNKDYLIVDQSPFIKGIGAGLGITSNAVAAFEHLGIAQIIKDIAHPLPFLALRYQDGQLLNKGNPEVVKGYDLTNYAIHRADLHQTLLAQLPSEKIIAHKKCTQIEKYQDGYKVHFESGECIKCKCLIGADGIHSSVRKYIFPESKIIYSGYTCWRATIINEALHPDASIETWGQKGRFGVTPLSQNRIYWYACINSKTAMNPFYSKFTIKDLQHNFQDYHQDIKSILATTPNDSLIHNDIYHLQPLDSYHSEAIVLIGDAAHATTPNLGQGACMGIEDAAVLLQELRNQEDIKTALANFSKRRVARCKYIVNTSTKMGQLAQLDNKYLIPIRNFITRNMPLAYQRKQFKKLLDTSQVL